MYTCIKAWLLPELSKQSCKAIVRELAYSDSVCTIDFTPWGFACIHEASDHDLARVVEESAAGSSWYPRAQDGSTSVPSSHSAGFLTLHFCRLDGIKRMNGGNCCRICG